MAIRIQRKQIINKRQPHFTAVDPAQMGAYYARLGEQGKLTLTGIRNQVLLRAEGVLAAKWENEETLLMVVREEAEDEPVALHAFKSRTQAEWETEDFPTAHVYLSEGGGEYVAVAMAIPNDFVVVLRAGKVSRDYEARTNLGAPAESIGWSDESEPGGGPVLTVATGQHFLRWSRGMGRQFKKAARQ